MLMSRVLDVIKLQCTYNLWFADVTTVYVLVVIDIEGNATDCVTCDNANR